MFELMKVRELLGHLGEFSSRASDLIVANYEHPQMKLITAIRSETTLTPQNTGEVRIRSRLEIRSKNNFLSYNIDVVLQGSTTRVFSGVFWQKLHQKTY